MKSAEDILIDKYGCKDLEDLKQCFLNNTESLSMILEAMEEYTAQFQKKERKPEFETCGHCGAENCRNNETCIKCDKLRTWIP